MTEQEFIQCYGSIYEHSPWVAAQAYADGKMTDLPDVMRRIVDGAGQERQLTLLRAHPDLARKAAMGAELTAESTAEQQSAGLDHCTAEELQEIQNLNENYRQKFGFPFIIAVRGLTRADIMSRFRMRINNAPEDEFQTALTQVHKIACLRLGQREGK